MAEASTSRESGRLIRAAVVMARRRLRRRGRGDEESLNTATHGLGLALGLAGAVLVIVAAARYGGAWEIVGCAIYAGTLVAVYAASTLSHAIRRPMARHVFRIADQAVIFLFIAGSYTPVALSWLRGGPWWVLHASVWSVALAGFIAKVVYAHNVTDGSVSPRWYVLLGLMPLAVAWPMVAQLPAGLIAWLSVGGMCYLLGIVFFSLDGKVRYFHAAWHLLVLAGSACHYLGILRYCAAATA